MRNIFSFFFSEQTKEAGTDGKITAMHLSVVLIFFNSKLPHCLTTRPYQFGKIFIKNTYLIYAYLFSFRNKNQMSSLEKKRCFISVKTNTKPA